MSDESPIDKVAEPLYLEGSEFSLLNAVLIAITPVPARCPHVKDLVGNVLEWAL